ncbi:glycosyltransferase family 1 protein [Salibacterium salarium]|uniref:Glycosyltransferase family 1 protein n=1 Tax=Salibacterium salarium TaxID=284579 RepID=A0A3R9PJ71_9BACI|nr:glycosyltransferase family 1 protein [Salibacterium salarium]RSL31915.1 glycosyltransferase family 1 protein [Salibacterium salarium]
MKPIRVLQVVVNMNRGGAETLLMNLYRNIDKTEIQFDFLTCKQGEFDNEIREMGGIIHRIPYVTDVGHRKYLKELDYFFSSHKEYDIVHAHMDKMSGYVLRVARKNNIQIRVAHSHSTGSEGSYAAKLYKWYAGKQILPNATNLMACSDEAGKWLFPSNAKSAIVLKNGVDTKKFTVSQKWREGMSTALNIPPNSFVVSHVGRIAKPKNHTFLIDIFAKLITLKPNAVLIVAGEGPLQHKVESKVSRLGLKDKVQFVGVRQDIHKLMHITDVVIFPSLYEGLGITLIEAQSAGVHCITSDVIPREVDIGAGLITFESLKKSAETWAKHGLKNKNRQDSGVLECVKNKGYDIKDSAYHLQTFYVRSYKNVVEKKLSNHRKII